jgi:MFS family permease
MAKFISDNGRARFKVVFRSLQYRNYRLFFSGQSVSLIGTWMQRIALPWLVYNMTGSAFLLGVVSFAGQIPTFFIAPFAGVLTDKWSRYRVLLVTQFISMLQAFILAGLCLSGTIKIWQIVILSIVMGCVNAFDVPARQSFVVNMVEKKEDLGNAIALNSLMFNGARLIGPSIAGVLLVTAGEGICFLLNAVSYIFVIVSLLAMRITFIRKEKPKAFLFRDMKDGLNYTFGFSPIKYIIILLGVVSLMGSSYQILMPVFAKEVLHGRSHTYGFLMGAAGFGALLSALFLASRKSVIKLGRLVPAATALFATGLIALSFTSVSIISMFLMIFIGMGLMLQTASSNTILQTITDDDKRGRVMSFYTMAIMGTAPFGSLLAGFLAKTIGTPGAILTGGLSCLAGALLFLRKLPALKNLVRPVYVRMGIIPEVAAGIQTASEPVAEAREVTIIDAYREKNDN